MSTDAPDFSCGGCGYNLRGLDPAGRCPECGRDVRWTLSGHDRAEAWLRRLARGTMLIGGGLLLGAAWVVLNLTWGAAPWLSYLFPAAAILGAIGTWLFATPGPTDHDPDSPTMCAALRCAGVATCALQVLAWSAMSGVWAQDAVPLVQIASLVWAVASVLTCVRAGALAASLHDLPGLVQAWIIGTLACVANAIAPVAWGGGGQTPGAPYLTAGTLAAMVLTAGWSIVFFLGFTLVLRRAARATSAGDLPPPSTTDRQQPLRA